MNKSKWLTIFFFGFWLIYVTLVWTQAFYFDEQGNLWVNYVNMWGDWAAHFTMGSRMAYDQLLPQVSPFISTQNFSYPFLTNLISALLIRAGVPFLTSFILPSYIFSLLTIGAVFFFFQTIFQSIKTAIISSLLFLLNGGLGFYYFLLDLKNSPNWGQTLLSLPREYTDMESLMIRWISVIDSMIIPQRAFTLGFPLALITLTLIYRSWHRADSNHRISPWIVGPILGILPIIHTHSFLASFIILSIWAVGSLWLNRDKQLMIWWLKIAAIAATIATPIYLTVFGNQIVHNFINWYPGWYVHDMYQISWLWFWLLNWGIMPILALLGLVYLIKETLINHWLVLFSPFVFLFILANLFIFQPFIWDNTKIVVWASIGFSGLAGNLLVQFWQKKKPLFKIAVALIFSLSIFSGSLDTLGTLQVKSHTYKMYTAEELELAAWVKINTPSDSIWLTGDKHNHWLYNLTGRQTVQTFRGWLWTHGYDYDQVSKDVEAMYQNPIENLNLFEQYKVNYVVIGENELTVWQANKIQFSQLQLIKESPNYLIYAL